MILNQFEELARQADLEWPIVCPLQYRLITIADEFAMLHGEPINLPLWEAGLRFEGVDDFKQERRKAHAKFIADLGKLFVDGDAAARFAPWHANRELFISPIRRTPVHQDERFTAVYYMTYYCRIGVS